MGSYSSRPSYLRLMAVPLVQLALPEPQGILVQAELAL